MVALRFGPKRLALGAARLALALLLLLILILAGLRSAAALREDGAAPPPATRMVATPHGAVAVSVSGPANGRPVILVHGTAAWGGFWTQVADHLARQGWRVVAVDLPPFGWSEHDPGERYDRVTQSERLAAVLARVARRPAVVVGHSFGAGPATELAFATLPSVGHIPHIEDPEAFLAALDSAIAPDREGAGN